MRESIHGGKQEQRQRGRGDEAADDDGRERTLHLAAGRARSAIGTKPSAATSAVISTGRGELSARAIAPAGSEPSLATGA